MRTVLLVSLLASALGATTFQVRGTDVKPWAAILGSVGMTEDQQRDPEVMVAGPAARAEVSELAQNHFLIVEGTGPVAAQLGIHAKSPALRVRQICDTHAANTQIFWEHPVDVAPIDLPAGFQMFATEKWKNVPVLAGKRTVHGAILWLATEPGASGIERFPYLLQALADLGWTASAESTNLWAFFDSSYRIRADPEYLARHWRRAGIAVLHAAAWHNMEPDAARDEYLKQVIEACHRNAISVYAWLELPHVSEKFWADYPEWREKTAVGQDAQLDWRKLMNLQNPDCRRAIAKSVGELLGRFDWDGVNLAELYFESLEGAANPARFTPMNRNVRENFRQTAGLDPQDLFDANSPYFAAAHPEALRKFLDYRAALASHMQQEWLETLDQFRKEKPYLDVTITHIDDRFEPGIRDQLGADVAHSLPMIEARKDTLLVEDPAPLWALGPERYALLASKYRQVASPRARLAVDINVVERYQDVYPTKKQTGLELLELVHQAAVSFGQVALYFESSLEKQDLALLPAAATSARVASLAPDELDLEAPQLTRVAWRGPVEVDGKTWPVQDNDFVLAPGGKHRLSAAIVKPAMTIRDFNGEIISAISQRAGVDISYQSRTRAIAVLETKASLIAVDGAPYANGKTGAVLLPSGQHVVSFTR